MSRPSPTSMGKRSLDETDRPPVATPTTPKTVDAATAEMDATTSPMDVESSSSPSTGAHPAIPSHSHQHHHHHSHHHHHHHSARHCRGSLLTLLRRPTQFGNETGPLACGEFTPCTSSPSSLLQSKRVLVVGAGGLGCELLKDLALSGIGTLHVIDMDTIDVTNLNRQFLFRHSDVGQSKAVTAANFVKARCPWTTTVTAHHGKIQSFDPSWYKSFHCVVAGLDNVEARRWLNATLVGLVETDEEGEIVDPDTIVPMIDGGTEALAGQARIILPRLTSCFECTMETFPPPTTSFPLCTIAETPRRPEHCIAYAFLLQWPRDFGELRLDQDSPHHMRWVYETALARAKQYHIEGVTYMNTLGVVKNIIPAVASTNAIVSAACVNEAIKYLTFCSQSIHTYMMYMGADGVHSHTFCYDQKPDCPVCRQTVRSVTVPATMTLNQFIQQHLKDDQALRLTAPSLVSSSGTTLYMPKPVALERATRPNLDKALSKLLSRTSGGGVEEVTVTDPLLESTAIVFAIQVLDQEDRPTAV